jgi:hypothetical protein
MMDVLSGTMYVREYSLDDASGRGQVLYVHLLLVVVLIEQWLYLLISL